MPNSGEHKYIGQFETDVIALMLAGRINLLII
jgi:hypothetical protein